MGVRMGPPYPASRRRAVGLDYRRAAPSPIPGLPLQEGQQVARDALALAHEDAVRDARILDELRALDALRRAPARDLDRHRLVGVAVQDERGHVHGREIGPEV